MINAFDVVHHRNEKVMITRAQWGYPAGKTGILKGFPGQAAGLTMDRSSACVQVGRYEEIRVPLADLELACPCG